MGERLIERHEPRPACESRFLHDWDRVGGDERNRVDLAVAECPACNEVRSPDSLEKSVADHPRAASSSRNVASEPESRGTDIQPQPPQVRQVGTQSRIRRQYHKASVNGENRERSFGSGPGAQTCRSSGRIEG